MLKIPFFEIVLTLLVFVSWLVMGFWWGSSDIVAAVIPWMIAFLVVASALVLMFRSLKSGLWIFIGLLILGGLFIPNANLVAHPIYIHPQPFGNLVDTLLFLMPSLALVMAAMLLRFGLDRLQEWRMKTIIPVWSSQSGRSALVSLGLGGVILFKTLENLYWLTIWDHANDPLGYLLLFAPLLAVLASGWILFLTLQGRRKVGGLLYSLVVLALLFAVSASAQKVDFRQLTDAHAAQISQALENYHARTGRYPRTLADLVPGTMLSIPGPVIIYGQGWCYQAEVGSYALGYIDRDHWSSPLLTGRVLTTQGQPPDLSHLCDDQMAALWTVYPAFSWVYRME